MSEKNRFFFAPPKMCRQPPSGSNADECPVLVIGACALCVRVHVFIWWNGGSDVWEIEVDVRHQNKRKEKGKRGKEAEKERKRKKKKGKSVLRETLNVCHVLLENKPRRRTR